ncbi:MAG: two-component regulator propeller domain-containing protein [Prolixibacteraceae bacterium]
MRKSTLFFLLVIFLSIFNSNAQAFSFKRIAMSDGLSNSWVRCFYQDDLGFIWIGTADGLNRYDGKDFKVYRPLNDQNFAIGNVAVNDIIKSNDSILWLASDVGLYAFNVLSEVMTLDTLLQPHPILTIEKDRLNNFWFGTNHGLIKFNPQSRSKSIYTSYSIAPYTLSNDYINKIKIDSNNNVWVGTKNGLNFLKYNSQEFNIYKTGNEPESINGNDITCIYEDHENRIWIGTALNGLCLTNQIDDQLHFEQVIKGSISDIYCDESNQLWVAHSIQKGITIIDLTDFNKNQLKTETLQNDPLNKNSISDNSIFCFFEDRLHDLWIGTYGQGVNFYSTRAKLFHNVSETNTDDYSIHNSLVNTFFDDADFLWIGTEGGLDRMNKKSGKIRHFQHNPNDINSLASNPVLAINKDSRGNLWVGTWAGGLHRYNYKTNNFKRFTPGLQQGSIGSANVFSIVEDHKQQLWIGTVSGGLNLFDYATETFTVYKNRSQDSSSLTGRSMNCILPTQKGELLIAEYTVIDRYNYQTNNFTHINRLSTKYHLGTITSLFEDSKNNIWLCTNTGLELLDSLYNVSMLYTSNEGLSDNTIQAILEDDFGNLWISTNKGISKFVNGINRPDQAVFQNFSIADGLPANDFKSRSALKSSDGFMYFGTSNGFTYFHPDSIYLNTIVPQLVFTNLDVQQSNPNQYSTFQPYKANLNLIKQVDLFYPNTDFTIEFAALNYLNSEKNQYQFKLEGYDTEWISVGNINAATYTNLPEGVYDFRVYGSNNDGIWSNKDISIRIKIHPVWWLSRWFKLFIFLFALVISITIIALRFISMSRTNKELEIRVEKRTTELSKLNRLLETKQTKISEQNKELEKHQNHLEKLVKERTTQLEVALLKAEESDKLKSSFLANMSHEIRTPMNAIIGFSAMLSDPTIPKEKREKYIYFIKTNGNNLNVLINDIIDISLIEAKQMILSKTQFNVNKILSELFHYFDMENKNKFDFVYLNANVTRELTMYNDANRFRQIMVNLLSNAFKYSDTGKIEYGYEMYETEAQFFVSDNGIGIEPSEKEHIFRHFYKSQSNKTKLYRGTGIGLAICKNLVGQMGGKIWVESKLNAGSTFYFTLPIAKK